MMKEVPAVGIDFFNFRISDTTTRTEIEEIAVHLSQRLRFSKESVVESIYSELRAKRMYASLPGDPD